MAAQGPESSHFGEPGAEGGGGLFERRGAAQDTHFPAFLVLSSKQLFGCLDSEAGRAQFMVCLGRLIAAPGAEPGSEEPQTSAAEVRGAGGHQAAAVAVSLHSRAGIQRLGFR